MNVLDVAENSVAAGATLIEVDLRIYTGQKRMTLAIIDNGKGMSEETAAQVTDPFFTTRTTRKVGLGLPLFRLAAEQTGGRLSIESEVGKGTTVTAVFAAGSIDCPPLGDMAGTVALLCQGAPEELELTYTRRTAAGEFRFDTRQVREILGPGIPLAEPEVAQFIREYVAEGEESVK